MRDETVVFMSKRTKPSIWICAGELPRMVEETQNALIRANSGIYQRGGELVRIAMTEAAQNSGAIRRAAGSHVILQVTPDYLLLAMSRAITWKKEDARTEKKSRTVDAPKAVATALLASAGEWRFPHLAGIVRTPTLRPDGTLLSSPGYDATSGLYVAFSPEDFPKIPEAPTRADAERALALLRDMFSEFDFQRDSEPAHASVLVGATITACVRHALPTAPGFAVSAAKPGSGKTTAASSIAQIPLGHAAPVLSHTTDETELRKVLLALLSAGDAVVIIDNIAQPVDSAALCAVLTSPQYRDRVLGASRQITVSTATTWLFTGNHLEFVGDLTSRTLLCVLDPEHEHPESRPFRRDLATYVAEHRGELLAAALTISLAYRAAGSPPLNVRRSRFREWDAFVRYPLLWLGSADPLDTQADLCAVDPVREALLSILTAWHESFGSQPTTVAQAIEAANTVGMSARPRLRDALTEVANEKNGDINPRRLGRYLTRSLRRIEGGLRLVDAGNDPLTHRRRFCVTGVTGVSTNPSREKCSANSERPVGNDADNAFYAGEEPRW